MRRPGQRDRAEAAGLGDAKEILEVGLLPKHRLVVGVVAGLLVATLQQRHAARTLGHHLGQLDPIGFVQGHRHPELRRVGARVEVRLRDGRQASLRPRVRPSCTSTVPSPRWKVGPSPWPSRHRRHSRSELASLSARLGMRCRRRGGPLIADDARCSRAKESSVRSRPGMAESRLRVATRWPDKRRGTRTLLVATTRSPVVAYFFQDPAVTLHIGLQPLGFATRNGEVSDFGAALQDGQTARQVGPGRAGACACTTATAACSKNRAEPCAVASDLAKESCCKPSHTASLPS